LALLTNILAPYRLPIYDRLAREFELTVLYAGNEGNRTHWQGPGFEYSHVRLRRSWGITLPWHSQDEGVRVERFVHLNPGLFVDLFELRPDAVITSEMGLRTLTALSYGKVFSRPVWVWWGGTVHTERMIGLRKRIFRRLLAKQVPRWFTYGQSSTEYLLTLGVRPETLTELQNCVPESRYLAPVSPAVNLEPKPVLLYVGQFIRRKGVDLLVEAAARVQAQGFQLSLLLVGDGPEKRSIEAKVQSLQLRNAHFHVSQPPDRMPAVYRSGDVLVFPTLVDNWGLVVNEALWSGLPALVSRYAGCARELVPVSSTFDPLNADDFTYKLRQAVTGQLPPPDLSRLRRIDEVSDLMVRKLDASLTIQ
jgi:glycosyltransferase involved in cell wall biosynthesis